MTTPAAGAAPTRVLHLTDPHLFSDTRGVLRGRATHDCLSRVIGHFRQSAWAADLAVVTGDLVQDDSRGAYEHCGTLLAALELPVVCVPGNHDVPELMREVMQGFAFVYCGTLESRGWLIVGIDTVEPGNVAGRVSRAELDRLGHALRDTRAPNALIAVHHPPVPVGTPWLDEVGLRNGSALLDAAAAVTKENLVCLSGHVHQAFDTSHGDARILATPSTCRQFLPGSDTFAVDDRPPGYRRLTLYPDGRVETDVVWIR